MKTARVDENSGDCIYSIGLKSFLNCLSVFHLVFYIYIYIAKLHYESEDHSRHRRM